MKPLGEQPESPDRWLELSVPAPPRGEELLLVEALRCAGAREVGRKGERYTALIPAPRDLEAFLLRAKSVIAASTSLRDPRLEWSWREQREWAEAWAAELPPRRVGSRIIVSPAGREPPTGENDVLIRLVPGTAFGTAEHATTRSCLDLLEGSIAAGQQLADVGTGSGILAVAAALLGAAWIIAFDADSAACALAERNATANSVDGLIKVRRQLVRPGDLSATGRFHGILANLQSDILLPLLPDIRQALVPDGWAIVSGITDAERPVALAAASAAGMVPATEMLEDGWWTARLRRTAPGPLGQQEGGT